MKKLSSLSVAPDLTDDGAFYDKLPTQKVDTIHTERCAGLTAPSATETLCKDSGMALPACVVQAKPVMEIVRMQSIR